MSVNLKKYLLYFAQEFVDFRYPEVRSVLKLFNIEWKIPDVGSRPYWIIETSDETELKKLASRSLSLKFVFEIWSHSSTYEKFHEDLKTFSTSIDSKYLIPSFKMSVESYNKRYLHEEKIQKIETMDYLPFKGPVDLKSPTNKFIYFEYFGMDTVNSPPEPEEIAFGRWIADGQRDMIKDFSLKTRKFIGNTSMEPQLSLLMANQAMCDKNQLMYDPFAGYVFVLAQFAVFIKKNLIFSTGSLLISAAKFGSYVMGSDIDFLMLHGRTKPSRVQQKIREEDENIKSNMMQYNLEHMYIDVFVSDFSNCPFVESIQFDSVITDRKYKRKNNNYSKNLFIQRERKCEFKHRRTVHKSNN